jgi:hypothetical protein
MCSSKTFVALYPLALLPFALFSFTLALFAVGDRITKLTSMSELPIIQKTYDLIKWYVPLLNRLPRDYKFQLGNRMVGGMYD